MLKRLTVDNYALIEHLEIGFGPRLNIITGETGAGKSILMGALGLLLGGKCDAGAIKEPSRNCIVEGEFDLTRLELLPLFEQNDLDYDDQTVIRRIISPAGKSRAYVNDQPVPLSTLKAICDYLIDIHSQHLNLILTSGQFRIGALDTIAGNSELKQRYGDAFAEMNRLRRTLAQAREAARRAHDDEAWLRHQCEELTAAALRPGESEELEAELRILENADRIGETLLRVNMIIDDESAGAVAALKDAETSLRRIAGHYPAAAELAGRLHSAAIELKDIGATVGDDAQRIESNPQRAEQINERLSTLYDLCRKHRADDVAALAAIRDDYAARLNAMEHGDENISLLESQLAECTAHAEGLAHELHCRRAEAASGFGAGVETIIGQLGMAGARFAIELTPAALTSDGGDAVDFLFSANARVAPRPIDKIASGGEMSRVMLALKSILATRLSLPTIVFDEIDTGVSGRVANSVGEIIVALAGSMQVIDITHLPQVASKGSCHLLVYKEDGATRIRELNHAERVVEIAKLLSGESVTEAALAQARILLAGDGAHNDD